MVVTNPSAFRVVALPNDDWEIVGHALIDGGSQHLEAAIGCAVGGDAMLLELRF